MLAREHRLVRSADFGRCVRRGSRGSSRCLTVHVLSTDDPPPTGGAPRTGFVVSKAVGNAVVRNRVQRQLRHLVRDLPTDLSAPAGGASLAGVDLLVVRAQPAAAGADSAELSADLERALASARRKTRRSAPAGDR